MQISCEVYRRACVQGQRNAPAPRIGRDPTVASPRTYGHAYLVVPERRHRVRIAV